MYLLVPLLLQCTSVQLQNNNTSLLDFIIKIHLISFGTDVGGIAPTDQNGHTDLICRLSDCQTPAPKPIQSHALIYTDKPDTYSPCPMTPPNPP